MEKFRFKVWRNDYTVTMKIFEQPEETRGKDKLFQHEDIEVCSVTSPELLDCVVFSRGNIKSRDHMAATITFDSLDEAEAYRKKITEALTAYARHLEEQEDNMKNMAKLKPCPFCGTPPSLELEMRYPHDPHSRVFGVKWEVICPYCGAKRNGGITQYVVGLDGTLVICKDSMDGRAKAIELWNERAGE